MGPVWLLALALVSPWERQGNRFTLRLNDGRAELAWVSASTFRFARDWNKQPSRNRRGADDRVEVSDFDTGYAVEFRTRYLTVEIRKSDLRLRVKDGQGSLLMEETAGARREGGAVVLEGPLGAAERVYGLGVQTLGPLDRRGVKTEAERPFSLVLGRLWPLFPFQRTPPFRSRRRPLARRDSGRSTRRALSLLRPVAQGDSRAASGGCAAGDGVVARGSGGAQA
ncbi:MAG: DUF4968 domain-containing protein, partial [Acidobacteria bacterium]|nr:DUF4968 domain-containing protein [Acidobacteriota bacterium]